MSNCVEIREGSVLEFSPDEIDSKALFAFLKKAEELISVDNCVDDTPELVNYRMAWWFLSMNTFTGIGDHVFVRLGKGRSSHTLRDLEGTINLVKTFLKKEKVFMLSIADEGDGYTTVEQCTF